MKKIWKLTPVLSPVLQNRRLTALLSFAALIQIGLAGAGLHGWVCPIQASIGVPCPGCGLSRATAALILGQWHLAITMHPFAPGFIAGILLLVLVSLLPGGIHARAVRTLDAVERHTGFFICIVISLGVQWSLRIIESISY